MCPLALKSRAPGFSLQVPCTMVYCKESWIGHTREMSDFLGHTGHAYGDKLGYTRPRKLSVIFVEMSGNISIFQGVVKGFVDWWSEKEWQEMWFLWVKKWSQESWVLWHTRVECPRNVLMQKQVIEHLSVLNFLFQQIWHHTRFMYTFRSRRKTGQNLSSKLVFRRSPAGFHNKDCQNVAYWGAW